MESQNGSFCNQIYKNLSNGHMVTTRKPKKEAESFIGKGHRKTFAEVIEDILFNIANFKCFCFLELK